jgi:hypothetical protein
MCVSREYRAVSGVFQNIDLPHPTLHPASVSHPPKAGGYTLAGRWGGGGSIFCKAPDIGLASYSIISLRCVVYLAAFYSNVKRGEPISRACVHALPLLDERVDHTDVPLTCRRVNAACTEPVRHQQRYLDITAHILYLNFIWFDSPKAFDRYLSVYFLKSYLQMCADTLYFKTAAVLL